MAGDLFLLSGYRAVGLAWRWVAQGLRGKRLKNARRKKGRKPHSPHRKALLVQQREEVGPRAAVTLNLSWLF